MFLNSKSKVDCIKVQEFLEANNYNELPEKSSAELISKYIHKHSNRFLFTAKMLPPLKAGAKILEIGGRPYCFSTLVMEHASCEVTTIDLPVKQFLGEPFNIHKRDVVIPNSRTGKKYRIASWACNAEKDTYPFENETFDVVVCTEVLEHLLIAPSHVFKESWRVLKNGGSMLVSTVNSLHYKRMAYLILNKNIDDGYSAQGPYGRHNKNFTREELVHLAKSNNFRVNYVTTATLRGPRNDGNCACDGKMSAIQTRNKFVEKIGKLSRKAFLNLVKFFVYLPLPGMSAKRHTNIYLLLQK
jgi:predicted SAM-dependent methyltransferase